MTSDYPVVPLSITVSQLVPRYIFTSGRSCFLVADENGIRGILTLQNIKSVPQPKWGMTQVKEIMTPVDKLKIAHPDQNVLSILEQMDEDSINQMPVVSEGGVIGLITRDSLVKLLRTCSELGI